MANRYIHIGGDSITSAQPGDIFTFQGGSDYSYVYIGNVNGTAENPIIVNVETAPIVMTQGITLENCTYVQVQGVYSGNLQGIKIHCPVPNVGVPIVIRGKSAHNKIFGVEASGGTGGFWIKTEVSDVQNLYHCDASYFYPSHIDDIEIAYCHIFDIGGDGFYLGDTDPYGTSRTTNCVGHTLPRPQGLSNIQIHDNVIERINRTGIQLSGGDLGVNRIYNNTISQTGLELNNTQGSGIFIGGATANCEVDHNTIAGTWDHGISSYGIGNISIHDNTISNTGILVGHTQIYALSNIFHNFNDVNGPAALKIENNVCGVNTDTQNDYKVAIFNSANNANKVTSVICNSGKVFTQDNVPYTTDCVGVIIPPPPSPHIVSMSADFKSDTMTYNMSDATIVTVKNVGRAVVNFKIKEYLIYDLTTNAKTKVASNDQ